MDDWGAIPEASESDFGPVAPLRPAARPVQSAPVATPDDFAPSQRPRDISEFDFEPEPNLAASVAANLKATGFELASAASQAIGNPIGTAAGMLDAGAGFMQYGLNALAEPFRGKAEAMEQIAAMQRGELSPDDLMKVEPTIERLRDLGSAFRIRPARDALESIAPASTSAPLLPGVTELGTASLDRATELRARAQQARPESFGGGLIADYMTEGSKVLSALGVGALLRSPAAATAGIVAPIAGMTVADAQRGGADFTEAMTQAATKAPMEFITQAPVTNLMLTPVRLLKGSGVEPLAKRLSESLVGRIGARAAAEGTQEALAEALTSAYDYAALQDDDITLADTLKRMGYGALVGSIIGGSVGIPASVAEVRQKAAEPVPEPAAPPESVDVGGVTLTRQEDADGEYWTAPGVNRAFASPEDYAEFAASGEQVPVASPTITPTAYQPPVGLMQSADPTQGLPADGQPSDLAATSGDPEGRDVTGGARVEPVGQGDASGIGDTGAEVAAPGLSATAPVGVAQPQRPAALRQPETAQDIEDAERRRLLKMIRASGIDITERSDITREQGRAAARMAPGLFRKNGRTIDDVASDLYYAGFISETDFNDVDGGVQAARDLVYSAITKSEPVLGIEARDRWAALRMDEQVTAEDIADELGVDQAEQAEMRSEGVDPANRDDVLDYWLLEQIAEDDLGAYDKLTAQYTEPEALMNAALEWINGRANESAEAGRRSEEDRLAQIGREAAEAAAERDAAGDPATQNEVAQGPESGAFSLAPQTEASRQQDEARAAQAEAEQARQRQQAEMRAQSEREAGDFTLTGSDRPADVGTSRGQGDIFASATERSPDPALDPDRVAAMAEGAKRREEQERAGRARQEEAVGQARRDSVDTRQATPQTFEGVEVLRIGNEPFVAVPASGRRNSAKFEVIDIRDRSAPVTTLARNEVQGWLFRAGEGIADSRLDDAGSAESPADESVRTASITRSDVAQAEASLTEQVRARIREMTGPEVRAAAMGLQRDVGFAMPKGKAMASEKAAEAVRDFPEATAERFGVTVTPEQKAAFTARMEGRVVEEGSFGPVFAGLSNKPEAAIEKLMTEKRGEVPDAFTHPELGPIAFVYGDEKMGLRHIEAKRDREFVDRIPSILRNGAVERDQDGLPRAYVTEKGGPDRVAVLRLDWDGEAKTWLVTAFPMEESGSGEQRKGISRLPTHSDAPFLGQKVGAEPESETTPAPESSPDTTRLDDFGEKLGGARKDDAPSLSRELTDEDIATQPLSKIWPKAEIDAVEDKFTAALLTAARAEIPPKPRKGYKLKRWVETVKQMRDMARTVQSVGRSRAVELAKERPALGNWFAKVRLLEKVDRDQWSRIGGVVEAPEAYTYVDGKRESRPAVLVEIDGRRSWFQGFGDIEGALPRIVDKLAGDGPAKAKMQFNVYTRRKDGVVFITKKGDTQKRVLREFETPKQAFAFINENYDDLVAEWEGVKDRDNVRKTDVRRSENRPRTGADRRNGRDADEAMFSDAFRFRGVEFGNWLRQGDGQKDRQGMLNEVYDALMDLADVVGVPPRAMSLGGTLGLGLGSRGKGGKAAAHFEPDTLVINLTKTKGAGSLAHEWFHALDNYFARKRDGGTSFQGTNFITYRPEPLMVRKDRSRYFPPMTKGDLSAKRKALANQTDNYNLDKWERDPATPEGVRPEVEERFADLVNALNESPMAARARLLDSDKKPYWSQIIERGARSFENYVISKMMEKGYQNDFLANVVALEAFTRDKGRYPYLMPEEVAPVAQAFDALFETIETQQDGDNVALFSLDGQTDSAAQTRTPEFKRWFGDWEAAAAERRLEEMDSVPLNLPENLRSASLLELRNEVRAHLDALATSGLSATHPDIGDVLFSKGNNDKVVSTSATREKLMAARDVVSVIEGSALVRTQLSTKPNEARVGTKYHTLATKVSAFGQEFVAVSTVRETRDGQRFYNTVAVEPAGTKNPVAYPREQQSEDSGSTSAFTGSGESVLPALRRVNPDTLSKVVDAEGRPRVVYHVTKGDFTQFREDKPIFVGFTEKQASAAALSSGNTMAMYARVLRPANTPDTPVSFLDVSRTFSDNPDADGVYVADEGGVSLALRSSSQLKSATGNRGTFDLSDPDISRLQSDARPASNRPDAPEWDRTQVERLNGILVRQAGQQVPLRAVEAPRAMRDLSQTMETLLGRKAVFFESSDPRAPAGVYVNGGVLFVNADAKQPLRHVLGHEFTHSLERPSAELHAALKARIMEMARDGAFPAYEARLKRVYDRDGLPNLSRAKVENEFVADVMGSIMSDPKMLFDLKQRMEPSMFRRLVNAINAWIDGLIARLRGDDMRQSDFAQRTMRDLEGAKALVADVLQATAEGQLQPQMGDAAMAGQPLFARQAEPDSLKRADMLTSMSPVSVDTPASVDAAATAYRQMVGRSVETADGNQVQIVNRALRKMRSHSADPRMRAVIGSVGELLPASRLLWSQPVRSKPDDSTAAFHHFGVRARIAGEPVFVRYVVRENVNGDMLYDGDAIVEAQKIPGASQLTAPMAAPRSPEDSQSIAQWLESVNTGSIKGDEQADFTQDREAAPMSGEASYGQSTDRIRARIAAGLQAKGPTGSPPAVTQNPPDGGFSDSEELRPALTLSDARSAAREFLRQPILNLETGLEATVSSGTLLKMTSQSAVRKSTNAADHARAVANVDRLFSRAIQKSSSPDIRGEPTIRAIRRFETQMQSARGGMVSVQMLVKETTDRGNPNPLYTVEAVEIEKPARMAPDSGIERGTDARQPPQAGSDGSVSQDSPDVNAEGRNDGPDDIAFMRTGQTDPDDVSALLSESPAQWAYRKIINRFSEVERAVKFLKGKGVQVSEEADPASLEKTFYGRTQTRIDDLRDQTEALFKGLNTAGVDFKQASDYLYALHALERNPVIAEKNSLFPDGGSGMSNRKAREIIREVEALPEAQQKALASMRATIRDINRRKLETLREGGLISEAQFLQLTSQYQDYVPLKSVVDPDEETPGTGMGFDQRSAVIREAYGRASRAEDPLAVTLLDAQKAIIRAEKNRVGRAMHRMVLETSGDDLMPGVANDYWKVMSPEDYPKTVRKVRVPEIDPETGRALLDSKGRPVMKEDVQYVANMSDLYRRDNVFMARVDGDLVVMEFKNTQLAKQLKNLGGEQLEGVLRYLSMATKLYGRMLTQWNPEFALPNLTRDIQTAYLNAFGADIDNPKQFANRVVRNLKAGFAAAFRGKDDGRIFKSSPEYREFLEAGGSTGNYGLTGVEEIRDSFDRIVKEQQRGATPGRAKLVGRWAVKRVERFNEVFENTTRFAIYKAARDAGMSKQHSARLAKDTTVNFNQKGESQWPGALYVFFNAAVQGNIAMLRAAGRSRITKAAMFGLMVFGLTESIVEREDEEEEPLGDAAGEWTLGREVTGFFNDNTFIKVPIAYGYNVPYALGRMIGRSMRGKMHPAEAVGQSLAIFMTSFMPTDTLIPSITAPFLNVVNNKNSFGGTVYRRSFGDDTYDPIAYRDYRDRWLTGTMHYLHDAAGGERYGPNVIKRISGYDPLSASGIEALAKGYFGPQIRLASATTNLLALGAKGLKGDLTEDDVPHLNDIPITRRFVNQRREFFYDSRFSDITREAAAAQRSIQEMRANGQSIKGKFNAKQITALNIVKEAAKADRKMRNEIEKLGEESERAKEIEAARDKRIRNAIRLYNQAFAQ